MTSSVKRKDSNLNTFIKYVVPSMLGMLAVSMNTVMDAIICGNGIGGNGIAGVNLGTPIISVSYAVGMLFGGGGGTVFSVYKGQEEDVQYKNAPEKIFTEALSYSLTVGVVLLVVIFLFRKQLPWILGATENTYLYAYDYVMGALWFIPAFIVDLVFNIFTRNDGAPKDSMIATCVCVIFNIIADYIFVFWFHMGTFGAAMATGLASVLSILVQIILAYRRKDSRMKIHKTQLKKENLIRIIKNGAGAFCMELSVGVIAMAFNVIIGEDIGDVGLSVYGILTTLNVFFYSLHSGVAQAVQPLISLSFGAGKWNEVKQYLKYSLTTALLTGTIYFVIGYGMGGVLASIMVSGEPETIAMAKEAIKIFFIIYIFMGVNIIVGTYYQSIEKGTKSLLVMFGRGMVLPIFSLIILRHVGEKGIWLAQPFGEAIVTLFILIALFVTQSRKQVVKKG